MGPRLHGTQVTWDPGYMGPNQHVVVHRWIGIVYTELNPAVVDLRGF